MTINDPRYLKKYQYRDPGNLNSRITIHTLFSTGRQDWAGFIFDQINPKAGEQMLELGCGHAAQWQVNLTRLPADVDLILSDLSMGMIKEARKMLAAPDQVVFLNQEAQSLAFPDQVFDAVIANHMLYHVPVPARAIEEAARVLKPQGRFLAATNGAKHMTELDTLLGEFEPSFEAETAMSRPFSLENGRGQIEPFFESVELIPYSSDLWVTDAELLADYVFSTPTGQIWFCKEQIGDLSVFFQRKIDQDGGIFIQKSTGVFRAAHPRR